MAISDLIGSSPKFRAVLDETHMVAHTDCAVLVQGETGTGKEVVARAIHDASPRRNNRFIAVNCATIPSGLLESELFGHERGAFTGAVSQSIGRFQSADRGTLFLDEIGDLPLELQPKLLRALQEQQFERLGGDRTFQVDVRVIAATNQDLWKMVQERKFRADLYYRLNVFPITLPPLRERSEDIPALVAHFVQKFAERQGKSIDVIPDEVMEALKSRDWYGNIRELQNFVERTVIRSSGPALQPAPTGLVTECGTPAARTLADAQRIHITTVLRETDWVLGGPGGAAARLGLPRTTLIARMRKLGIARPVPEQRTAPGKRVYAAAAGFGDGSPVRESMASGFSGELAESHYVSWRHDA
jgi:formate hydrogenlyase transcriptional activator